MIGIDTNLLVRLIAEDDAVQAEQVRALRASETLFVSLSVLMEGEWVLRAAHGWPRDRIARALAALLELDAIEIESVALAEWAIGRYRAGADLADMLHLVANRETEAFATFDRRLERQAGARTPVAVRILPSV